MTFVPGLARDQGRPARLSRAVGRGPGATLRHAAVHRTIPFTLASQSIATLSHATAGYHTADVTEHRARAPGTGPRPSHQPPT